MVYNIKIIYIYIYIYICKHRRSSIIILPFVPCGCETWPFALREDRILRMLENRVLRGIFRPKREEVAGGWRKLHNEELHNFYISPNIIKVMKSRG
jgi:hypothetical protein